MKPQSFYVKSRASQGVKVDLVDPAGSREWARIRSVVSEEFKREAEKVFTRAAREGVSLSTLQGRKAFLRERRAELAASLVADWSLPFKTKAEKVGLLIRNPRLRRGIERVAEDLSLHFGVSND